MIEAAGQNSNKVAGKEKVLMPLGQHPINTLNNLGRAHSGCVVRVSPFCHEHPNSQREVRGWALDVPSDAPAHVLPISFNLFDGVMVVQCEMTELEIFKLMQNMDEVRERLGKAVDKIMMSSTDARATWARCRPSAYGGFPQSLQGATRDKDGTVQFVRDEQSTGSNPIIDSEDWEPELSPDGFIGLYHHWHRSTRDNRLCIYVVCQSYLPKACLEFADLAHQVGEACTSGCVCLSEEAQWLKTACSRNRARLIWQVCEELGLRVPTMLDYNARNRQTRMAIPTTETLHHDLVAQRQDTVRVLNYCSETQRAFNGSVCSMAPWDGVWIFHGCRMMRSSEQQFCDFGFAYGGDQLLPTASPQVRDRAAFAQTPMTFSAADPAQCRPLQIWTAALPNLVLVDEKRRGPARQQDSATIISAVKTEGLDSDVVEAFQKIMLEQACPQPFFVPNIPGALPRNNQTVTHHLVFDEHVLEAMAQRGWARTQGVTILTPMACAMYDHWKNKGETAYDAA
jgi:hypothetical protein